MTSTSRNGGRAALLSLALAILAAAPAWAQTTDEASLRLNAVAEGAAVAFDGETSRTGDFLPLIQETAIRVEVSGPQGSRLAVLSVDAKGVLAVLNTLVLAFKLREKDQGLTVELDASQTEAGWVDLYHDRDKPYLLIEIGNAAFLLGAGAVRIERTASGEYIVTVASGEVSGESGGRQLVLRAGQLNSVTIAPDGTFGEPLRSEGLSVRMTLARTAIVQSSLLPDLVRVAESAAEGDIEPPARGSRAPAVAVAPEVRVSEIVPRGGVAVTVISGSRAALAGAPTQSTAEAFIGQGNAALAVVGARLQRTRIVGSIGAAGGGGRAPLTVSRELGPPLAIGRIPF